MIQLHTPAENATLDRLTPIQKAFMENSCAYAMEENDWRAQMDTTEREHSCPVPILFWKSRTHCRWSERKPL